MAEYASHEEFVDALRPLSQALEGLASAGYGSEVQGPETPSREPSVDSEAVAELAQQSTLAGVWDSHPIDLNLTHVGLLMHAGGDALRTFAEVILGDHTPLFSYQPIARFGLECLGLAHWLAEPAIGARERVRRSLNQRLQSAYEQSRLPSELNPEPDRRGRILAATELGFQKASRKSRVPHFIPEPPRITTLVRGVLGDDRLGTVMYSHLSAVSHGTIWGLANVADPEDHALSQERPIVRAALVNSSIRVAMSGLALVFAYTTANSRVFAYHGWSDERWHDAKDDALRLVQPYIAQAAP